MSIVALWATCNANLISNEENVTFMLFLKLYEEECPRTITPDSSKLNSPS